MNAARLRTSIAAELEGNLLPFWRRRCLDENRGGFIAEMGNDGSLRADAAKGLILNTRLLWTFSALFTERREPEDLALACRAWEFLETQMRDRDNGGYLWRVAPGGEPLDSTKKIYGQAFAIYALSAYALATGEVAAVDSARELFELIEAQAHDGEHGGYFETRAADWSADVEQRLSARDMAAAKSMNTHLHVLEAYTGLYRAWPEPRLAERLRELLKLVGDHILDLETGHLHHFFDERWNVLSDSYTYGHDIEAAWLLHETAELLRDPEVIADTGEWVVAMADAVLREAVDSDGGLAYEGRGGKVIDPNREWWCQAEAVVGFWQAFELTGNRAFEEAAAGIWTFIDKHVVDRANGEWFWRVFTGGAVDDREPKVSEWKGPYHNIRMCLEMTRRIDAGK